MAYLSFNDTLNSNLKFTTEDNEESEEMLQKDLPLRYTWSIWEQIMQSSDGKSGQYSDATHKVSAFSSVQEFWKLWNHMPQPSELLQQKRMVREQPDGLHVIDAIMIFRENIRPEWEDKMNAKGGHFQFQLKPNIGGGQIDEYWNNLVLGMIGATIEPANMITGLRLVDKLSGPRAANVIRIEAQLSEHDSFSVLESWGQCVKAKDRKAVLAHYAHNTGATLWPTLSNKLRKDEDHIEDYFVSFLAKIDGVGPVEWNEKTAQPMSDDCVMWSGVYTFHLNQGAVPARFSYLVKKIDGEWKIMHHHSSQMPE